MFWNQDKPLEIRKSLKIPVPAIDDIKVELLDFRFDDPSVKLQSNDGELYYFVSDKDVSWQQEKDIKTQITHYSSETTEATYLLADPKGQLHCLWIQLACINKPSYVPITLEIIEIQSCTQEQGPPDLKHEYIIEINGTSIYEFLNTKREIPAVDNFLNSGLIHYSEQTMTPASP